MEKKEKTTKATTKEKTTKKSTATTKAKASVSAKATSDKAAKAAPKVEAKKEEKAAPKAAAKPAAKAATTAKAASEKPKAEAPKKPSKPAKAAPSSANRSIAHGVGRRKSSVARVWLKRGNGKISVNGKKHTQYFDTDIARNDAATPFRIAPSTGAKYDVLANVYGGGPNSQAGAIRLGIARALVAADESLRITMRKHGLLTVDARVKERKKPGQKGARRKFQFVKR